MERIIPNRAELDENHEFPRDYSQRHGQCRSLRCQYSRRAYGGFGGGCFDIVLALEAICVAGVLGLEPLLPPVRLGIYPILISGSEEQKEKYLPGRRRQKNLPPSV